MELAFESRDIRSVCENHAVAASELGAEVAGILMRRLADLRSVVSICEFIDLGVVNCRMEVIGSEERALIDLSGGCCCMVLAANHPKNPVTTNGSLNWKAITRVKIIQIRCDHETE